MPARPPLYFQNTPSSCAPTCLRMVLAGYGYQVSEYELRVLCKCDDDGTYEEDVIEAAKQYGFAKSQIEYLQFEELSSWAK